MKNSILLIIVLFSATILTISCSGKGNNKNVKRYEIEFDGGKREFYNKYDMWLVIEDENNVRSLSHLIEKTDVKTKCNDIRPVMWIIKVHAVYEDDKNERIMTLTSSTLNREALEIGRNCYEASELTETLKILMNYETIKNYPGQMRQKEYDMFRNKG